MSDDEQIFGIDRSVPTRFDAPPEKRSAPPVDSSVVENAAKLALGGEPIFLGSGWQWLVNASKNWSVSAREMLRHTFVDQSIQCSRVWLACYGFHNYEGKAFVLFEEGGKLYEVNGEHCSCRGLEGQWRPEETSAEALLYRIENGTFGLNCDKRPTFRDDLLGVIAVLQQRKGDTK